MENLKTHKFSAALSILLVLFLLAAFSTNLIKNESGTKATVEKTSVKDSESPEVSVEEENNSAKVEVNNNQVKSEQTSQTSSNPGTCTVTRNGVVTIVPADQVNVNEKSSGDVTVKVECDNTTSSSNGNSSNKTSIKNNVNIDVSTSN